MFNTISDLHIDSDSFSIELEYSDGEHVKVNFQPIINKGGVMSALDDVTFFKKVSIDDRGRFIQWPNDLEFCADAFRIKYSS
jgi:hypothetical protein